MTRKHKPSIAAKKRPAAADSRKPVKAAAAEKAVAPVATVREKDRQKPAATLRKAPEEPVIAPVQTLEPARTPERPVDGKNGGAKNAVEKKPSLGIERRAPVMPEDRQSQLKLLIARGKEQGYLTYAQVNDHLP
jgi:septal ring-binding cell division protein DamX